MAIGFYRKNLGRPESIVMQFASSNVVYSRGIIALSIRRVGGRRQS
ncbi:TPA: hypothetical protein PXM39_003553 [Yersinia enterocolitica]|nr:hypothetical protein [Yersinia enterocolitica]HDL6900947.1 hypothetical protein [Yersinia enterocolitica]HDL7092053.1 hypothetical protein [Yersinia enterocolitica]HDL7147686.1 hypothetical protein [Yersinia enterocolitica]HDL7176960.1 hypothetical protein [Yersinia enterocolitica]